MMARSLSDTRSDKRANPIVTSSSPARASARPAPRARVDQSAALCRADESRWRSSVSLPQKARCPQFQSRLTESVFIVFIRFLCEMKDRSLVCTMLHVKHVRQISRGSRGSTSCHTTATEQHERKRHRGYSTD